MKYVLVDKGDNIVSTVELQWDVGVSGARTYFLGVKKMKWPPGFNILLFSWKHVNGSDRCSRSHEDIMT